MVGLTGAKQCKLFNHEWVNILVEYRFEHSATVHLSWHGVGQSVLTLKEKKLIQGAGLSFIA